MIFAKMLEAGCEYVFMEVSSHAIDQRRIEGIEYDVAAFTNISHDHLDYHGDMKEYIRVKKLFFDNLEKSAVAITNVDDKNGLVMVQNTKADIRKYSMFKIVDYKGKILDQSFEGLHMKINDQEAYFRISGAYNAYNLLTVIASATALGQSLDQVLPALTAIDSAEGRMELVRVEGVNIHAYVDYAHTPDALENVLKTLAAMKKGDQKIITVVGAGGDRDKKKRPVMAKLAALLSDQVILTSDNPRTEDPNDILQDMVQGVQKEFESKVLTIVDRKQAIKTATMIANDGDVILVAGKGHEKYQEINGVKTPFDDKKILIEIFQNR